jgi:hypothetical protein
VESNYARISTSTQLDDHGGDGNANDGIDDESDKVAVRARGVESKEEEAEDVCLLQRLQLQLSVQTLGRPYSILGFGTYVTATLFADIMWAYYNASSCADNNVFPASAAASRVHSSVLNNIAVTSAETEERERTLVIMGDGGKNALSSRSAKTILYSMAAQPQERSIRLLGYYPHHHHHNHHHLLH